MDFDDDHEEAPIEDLFDEVEGEIERVRDEHWLMDWEEWWQILVHRNVGVLESGPLLYLDDAFTLPAKIPPFPFNLDATWYCAALLALILMAHCELDTLWLLHHGYRHYLMRISSKTALTIALSFVSTLAYEILGNIHEMLREGMEFRVLRMERLQLLLNRTHLTGPVRKAISDTIAFFFQYLALLISSILGYIGPAVLVWFVGWISTNIADFISNLSTIFALPTPGIDEIFGFKTLFWEFGVPAYFQVCIAALLYLFIFLFMSKAERNPIPGRGGQDPYYKLAFELLRATAMHLLAYTAYQLVCICVVATKDFLLAGQTYDPLIDNPLVLKSNTQLAPGAGILVLAAHWLAKSSCRLCVRLAWPLWVPYLVWLSIRTEESIRENWVVFGSLLDEDMEVLNPDKRVIARATMTALFGLKSSWPARMRLSTADGVD
ncbi:cystathionine beta-synthase [Hypoxylon texense]